MTRIRKFLLAAAVSIAAAAPAAAQNETAVVETHGDWEIRCTPDKARCTMQQAFIDAEGRAVAVMTIARLQGRTTPDGTAVPAQMAVRVPLGVMLTEGLGVQVDSNKTDVAPFNFCIQAGCQVLTPVPESFISSLKAGVNAKVLFRFIDGNAQTATISLKGFTKAYNSLKPVS